MRPTATVDYPQETGLRRRRPWPTELNVGPNGIGRVRDLTCAVGFFEEWELNSPGDRVLGRRNIAYCLQLSEDQLSDRMQHDGAYRAHIAKVGWLLVTTLQHLFDLDERRRERLHAVRSAAAKQRRRRRT